MLRFYPGDTVRITTGKNTGRIGTVHDFECDTLGNHIRVRVMIWNSGKRKFLFLKSANVEFVRHAEQPEED